MTAFVYFKAVYRVARAGGRSIGYSFRLALAETIRPVEF